MKKITEDSFNPCPRCGSRKVTSFFDMNTFTGWISCGDCGFGTACWDELEDAESEWNSFSQDDYSRKTAAEDSASEKIKPSEIADEPTRKHLTDSMYLTIFPPTNIKYFLEMESEKRREYLDDVSAYYDLFLQYLIHNTCIKKYDDELRDYKECLFPFESVSEHDQDIYQYLCNHRLSYFYIRNNIYLERLDDQEREQLHSLKNSCEYNDQIDSFIGKTFRRVTSEITDGSAYSVRTNFGPATQHYFAPAGSIVIGGRIYEYVKSLDTAEEVDAYYQRIDIMDEICQRLEEELWDDLGMTVRVISYVEGTVRSIGEYL
ncbi:MAG: hypothetical protein K6D03_09160 [Solobacterium sp.]|nr:hypothetical protein [Solobacterium sp.]